jgi:hypothetical protein
MDEMYRMLGREHEKDLAREALKWQRADRVRRGAAPAEVVRGSKPGHFRRARVVALLARAARVA